MALTSDDVNNQSFSIERKGYNVDEVDAFLERVASDLDELHANIAQLESQLADAQAQPAAMTSSQGGEYSQRDIDERDARIAQLEKQVAEHHAEDNAIAQALIIAQRSADEILANANGAAETTRQDATDEAQRILDKANAEKQRVLDQIKKLEDDREAARDRFSDMLTDFIGNSQDILSDLQAGKAGGNRASHVLTAPRKVMTALAPAPAPAPAAPVPSTPEEVVATYTTPNVTSSSVVAPAAPKPSKVEKDFSGFGDTDDGFEFDDVD